MPDPYLILRGDRAPVDAALNQLSQYAPMREVIDLLELSEKLRSLW